MNASNLRAELKQLIYNHILSCSWNDFGNLVEATLGKQKADEYRDAAIKEGRWIKKDGKVYNEP